MIAKRWVHVLLAVFLFEVGAAQAVEELALREAVIGLLDLLPIAFETE
jgi:hypothetical protein